MIILYIVPKLHLHPVKIDLCGAWSDPKSTRFGWVDAVGVNTSFPTICK